MKFVTKERVQSLLRNPETGEKTWARELCEFIILIVVIVLPFRFFVAEPYIVSGVSMSETYETGHYLIINKFWHKLSEVERGDVLVFESPVEPGKYYIKRVIALPGETITINNTQVQITTTQNESLILEEDYIKNKTYANLTLELGPTEYYMMGDNRAQSFDSRSWGAMDARYIRGEPFIRLYPFNAISLMPGN